MKNSLLTIGAFLGLSVLIGCNNTDNKRGEAGHAHDSSDVMYNDGQSIYDTIGRDTLSTDSLIPPTPMN